MKMSLLAAPFCLLALSALATVGAAEDQTQAQQGALRPISSLNVGRYMGSWFEIAKYPNRFQKKCTGGATADYSLMPDGKVQVMNRCRVAGGDLVEALGVARQLGPGTSPKLEVRFAPAWLSFLPFVWGDYWVIELDNDYQLAAVSEPKREYLWILSRTPQVDSVRYGALLNKLREKGFDPERLQLTQQD